jgi:hypothetical protein
VPTTGTSADASGKKSPWIGGTCSTGAVAYSNRVNALGFSPANSGRRGGELATPSPWTPSVLRRELRFLSGGRSLMSVSAFPSAVRRSCAQAFAVDSRRTPSPRQESIPNGSRRAEMVRTHVDGSERANRVCSTPSPRMRRWQLEGSDADAVDDQAACGSADHQRDLDGGDQNPPPLSARWGRARVSQVEQPTGIMPAARPHSAVRTRTATSWEAPSATNTTAMIACAAAKDSQGEAEVPCEPRAGNGRPREARHSEHEQRQRHAVHREVADLLEKRSQ